MRRLGFLPLFLVLVLAALVVSCPAPAGKSKGCAKAVVADWYGDGRVDKAFPLRCYREAIRSLPIDVLDYSNAQQDILRALAFAREGEKARGGGSVDVGESGATGGSGSPGRPNEPGGIGTQSDASKVVAASGASSFPIPLVILGGLALLLLAAGGAGYLSRRSQGRDDGGPSDPA
jgi:hypothetical protein